MIKKSLGLVILTLLASILYLSFASPSLAEEDDSSHVDEVKKQIDELQQKLSEVRNQKQSLSSTINYLDTQVSLAETEINQTEAEIQLLEKQIGSLLGKIDILNTNLDKISEVLVNRISESYKANQTQPNMMLLLTNNFSDFFRTYKYLKVSQRHDREVIFSLEEARTNYDTQKQLKETKQVEVEALQKKLLTQKASLDVQKSQKQAALRITQNDEARYQTQLANAMAELNAIQSIIAGKGKETEVGSVKQGSRIASVIPGASTCSNGGHLHFEVTNNGATQNPANYLSSKSVTWDNSPDGSFGFSGGWSWPIDDPIRITQGYGMTFYASTLRYYGGAPHTGIDMINDNYIVKAVQDGTLYQGGIGCKGGTLRYVRVDHGDGISTFYLHVNY
jgi:septal ring factor EnvC (AmiA/AmiB activator)